MRSIWSFNPRARVRRDYHGSLRLVHFLCCFNPRARVRRDDAQWVVFERHGPFQSTRPREARQGYGRLLDYVPNVSIHAPA